MQLKTAAFNAARLGHRVVVYTIYVSINLTTSLIHNGNIFFLKTLIIDPALDMVFDLGLLVFLLTIFPTQGEKVVVYEYQNSDINSLR